MNVDELDIPVFAQIFGCKISEFPIKDTISFTSKRGKGPIWANRPFSIRPKADSLISPLQ